MRGALETIEPLLWRRQISAAYEFHFAFHNANPIAAAFCEQQTLLRLKEFPLRIPISHIAAAFYTDLPIHGSSLFRNSKDL